MDNSDSMKYNLQILIPLGFEYPMVENQHVFNGIKYPYSPWASPSPLWQRSISVLSE